MFQGDPLDMIGKIEQKAIMEIETLKRQKANLIELLNNEVLMHNDAKSRILQLEKQLSHAIELLHSYGINFPSSYHPNQILEPNHFLSASGINSQNMLSPRDLEVKRNNRFNSLELDYRRSQNVNSLTNKRKSDSNNMYVY